MKNVVVLDASAVVALLVNQQPSAPRLRKRLEAVSLHAPYLLDAEVVQVLRRYVFKGELTEQQGYSALKRFGNLELTHYPHGPFLERVWQLKANVSAYDAAYLALAEALAAPLLTLDGRLARAPGHEVKVELYA